MITIAAGRWTATSNPYGGSLAQLRFGDEDVVVPQDGHGAHPDYRGAVLAPWPNRLADGAYVFDGSSLRLPVTEPERGTALHGLVTAIDWEVREHRADEVRVGVAVPRSEGYPFDVDVEVRYALDAELGLTVAVTGTNIGDVVAPFGCGFHPYVRHGPDDDLQVAARTYVRTDPERLLPTGVAEVDGSRVDFRTARRAAGAGLDTAYGDLVRDAEDGRVGVRLGRTRLWGDAAVRWMQVYTPESGGCAAVEPCTCPPDAFASGIGLIRLRPGEAATMSCGIDRAESGDVRGR
ncbi:aldose 1-epimerase [Mumia flava]|uniref:Aldose 1-epimerase n=1 Tax=Mumia flava TaxID=1348852 RepID=A0A0B2BC55_9ACTN|nr:hypothetical protein [Mumia flava]PJJ57510.1 aldose 1-epimerase [Mumia flava]